MAFHKILRQATRPARNIATAVSRTAKVVSQPQKTTRTVKSNVKEAKAALKAVVDTARFTKVRKGLRGKGK